MSLKYFLASSQKIKSQAVFASTAERFCDEIDAPRHKYGRMIMCHLVGDTLEELHAMADQIGVARRWFQERASFPHYDICKAKRLLAVQAGAIEVNNRELVAIMRRFRANWETT